MFGFVQVAKEMTIDVSKYLAFCKAGPLPEWGFLLNIDMLTSYVKKLEDAGVGPEGITNKLDTTALTFLRQQYFMEDEFEAQ